MVNSGKEYELFCMSLIEKLSKQGNSFENIQHNQKLIGEANTPNQVDITFDYVVDGVKIPMIVECKDYSRNVSKDRIATLSSIANEDLGMSGIFMAKSGFQKGAIEYAKSHGIDVYKVNHVDDANWDNRMKNIDINMTITTGYSLEIGMKFVKSGYEKMQISQDLKVYDQNNNLKYVLFDKVKEIFKNNSNQQSFVVPVEHDFTFIDNSYIEIESINVNVIPEIAEQTIKIHAEDFIEGIVENAITGEWITVRK
ncbi:restriction endonuclease [Periweissella fabalis]|uniref:Restriction endonuclease n=1 Tax=Periweissella fabalis TaxID=1070421 RepID=A0A7X6N2C4_9LACO|nr:restriction endonuclease [Periweissella fabalis]MCM0599120.1 restriction endonuclease [Periweissella fabalis]NKZ23399.1 restriction endonuclease [Periweissella fabalis]